MLDRSFIIARAKRLGFSFIGFTGVEQTPHYYQYESFVDQCDLGDLQFLGKDYVKNGREKPFSLLENAQTVIVLGVTYKPVSTSINDEHGFISAYAQYPDYHHVLREKAHLLVTEISAESGKKVRSRIFIDSGPMMEKDMFFSAGLGWIGKHSIAIHPSFGSFFFIFCIMLNEPIQFDKEKVHDLCGKCEICTNACPTSCIHEHSIDPIRCISYLTIEHHGVIPRELRAAVGQYIFGCDICQNVCPLNKHIAASEDGALFGSQKLIAPAISLADEISFNEEQFQEKYGLTPLSRLSLIQFKRNILTAMGNTKNLLFFNTVAEYLSDPSTVLRCHAAWALTKINKEKAQIILTDHLINEVDPYVIEEIKKILL